jgi:hypothetical protein
MTTERNFTIYQGQSFTLSLDYVGTVGRGQRMHIRLADSTATVVQILTHNGDANARVIYNDTTQQLDITIGASVSSAWVVLADRVEWVYDIEDYDLSDVDDVVVPYRGRSIIRGNRTRESDVTPSAQMPSGDGRYVRFDTDAQGLSDAQKLAARTNIGAGTGGGGGSGDVVGPASATDDRIAAFDGITGKLIKQGSVTATEVASHLTSTSDPHGDRAYADGLAVNYATAAQGGTADTAIQPGDLATVATTGAYSDLSGLPTLGTAAALDVAATGDAASGEVVKGSDTRLTDSRAPTSHNHSASEITSGTIATARLGSGTADSTTFLCGDQTYKTPPGLTKFTEAESTSSPNATVYVGSLTAAGASTDVDFAACPKGQGAFLTSIPDSTTTGGNKRGAYAVDLQHDVRTVASQVASGSRSVIGGGSRNTASGSESTVSGGSSNVASNNYTTVTGGIGNTASGAASTCSGYGNTTSGTFSTCAGGTVNIASGTGSWITGGTYGTTRGLKYAGAYSMPQRAAAGDRQAMVMPLACAATTDATPTVLTSDAAAAGAANQVVLPNNSTHYFEVDVVAHDASLKSASWKIQGTIRRGANAASTTIVGTNVTTTLGSDLSGGAPGATVTADTTNGALCVTFTGIAATTIYPTAHVRTHIAA